MLAKEKLDGPHRLTFESITAVLQRSSPGVFALGYKGRDDAFYINYIGRSDHDVRSRLLELIGSDVSFKFGLTDTAEEAFIRECELFHAFRPPANRVHPGRPATFNWACPRCSLLNRWQ